jgi:parvulin-like peptidyl-prolyl isomerase
MRSYWLVPVVVLAMGAGGNRQVVDRVAAIVNDAVILESELQARMLELDPTLQEIQDPTERERRRAKLQAQMLEDMISEQLILDAAHTAKLTVETSEVEAVMEDMMQRYKLTKKELEDAMKQRGVTPDFYRDAILIHRTVNQILGPKLSVSEAEIKDRYDEILRNAIKVVRVQIAHIVIDVPEHATDQIVADLRVTAQMVLDRANTAGQDFGQLAAQWSDDASTKAKGGVLGWRDENSIEPGWESVFTMKRDEVRGPFKTERGFHILKVIDLQTTAPKRLVDMRAEITEQLKQKQLDKLKDTWVAELRKKAYVDIKLH